MCGKSSLLLLIYYVGFWWSTGDSFECEIRATSDSFFRQKSGDRSQESELVLTGIAVLGIV